MKLRGSYRLIGLVLASVLAALALHAQLNFGDRDASAPEQMLRFPSGARGESTFEAFRPVEEGLPALTFDSRWVFPASTLAADGDLQPAMDFVAGNSSRSLDVLFLTDFSAGWGMSGPISDEMFFWAGPGDGGFDAKPAWLAVLPAAEFHLLPRLEPVTFGWLGAVMLGALAIAQRISRRSAALSVPNFHPLIEHELRTADHV